jgi:hypothetical protein
LNSQRPSDLAIKARRYSTSRLESAEAIPLAVTVLAHRFAALSPSPGHASKLHAGAEILFEAFESQPDVFSELSSFLYCLLNSSSGGQCESALQLPDADKVFQYGFRSED